MTDELVAYLLDDLCPDRRAEVERRLAEDAEWQGEFDRLKECFATTSDPAKCVAEPPGDLVARTCQCVERAGQPKRQRSSRAAAFAAAPITVGTGSNWSFADMAVAGGVLTVLAMLVLPALRESRDAARRTTCQNNLRELGTGLIRFQDNHGHWLPTIAPDAPAGMFAVSLADDVGINRGDLAQWLVCPESPMADQVFRGEVEIDIPHRAELAELRGRERVRVVRTMAGTIAYRVGFEDELGQYHDVKYTGAEAEPMLADAARSAPVGVRSASHDGCGQNVLYQPMCVKYCTNSDLAESVDSLYLNRLGLQAAGYGPGDVVMLGSDREPEIPDPIVLLRGAGTPGIVPLAAPRVEGE
jgi:hypothetical protein